MPSMRAGGIGCRRMPYVVKLFLPRNSRCQSWTHRVPLGKFLSGFGGDNRLIRQLFSKTGIRFAMKKHGAAVIKDTLDAPFEILKPSTHTAPFVFNSPHSGRVYLQDFVASSRLDLAGLRRSEDTYVEQLFSPMVEIGAPLMHANFPRAYLDVNREPYELDPALIAEALPRYANTQSVRVVGGLGTIARVVTESEEIYRAPLRLADALERINLLYKPYHEALDRLMTACVRKFDLAVLIDCHSMPSTSLYESGSQRPDFVLGDRFSTSCNPEFTRLVAAQLKAMGYVVAFNKPYAGGFITEYYGRPSRSRHALQIEINRSLYMNETNYEPHAGFDTICADLRNLAHAMTEMVPAVFGIRRAAAE